MITLSTPIQTTNGLVGDIHLYASELTIGTSANSFLTWTYVDAYGRPIMGSPMFTSTPLTSADWTAFRAAMPSGIKAALNAALQSNQPAITGAVTST